MGLARIREEQERRKEEERRAEEARRALELQREQERKSWERPTFPVAVAQPPDPIQLSRPSIDTGAPPISSSYNESPTLTSRTQQPAMQPVSTVAPRPLGIGPQAMLPSLSDRLRDPYNAPNRPMVPTLPQGPATQQPQPQQRFNPWQAPSWGQPQPQQPQYQLQSDEQWPAPSTDFRQPQEQSRREQPGYMQPQQPNMIQRGINTVTDWWEGTPEYQARVQDAQQQNQFTSGAAFNSMVDPNAPSIAEWYLDQPAGEYMAESFQDRWDKANDLGPMEAFNQAKNAPEWAQSIGQRVGLSPDAVNMLWRVTPVPGMAAAWGAVDDPFKAAGAVGMAGLDIAFDAMGRVASSTARDELSAFLAGQPMQSGSGTQLPIMAEPLSMGGVIGQGIKSQTWGDPTRFLTNLTAGFLTGGGLSRAIQKEVNRLFQSDQYQANMDAFWGAKQYIDSLSPQAKENADIAWAMAISGGDAVLNAARDMHTWPQQIVQLETAAQVAQQQGDDLLAAQLGVRANTMKKMGPVQIIEQYANPLAEIVYGTIVDPGSLLGGWVAKATRATTLLRYQDEASALFNIGEAAARSNIDTALREAQATLDTITRGQKVNANDWLNYVNPLAWFNRTPESKANLDANWLLSAVADTTKGVTLKEDAKLILSALRNDATQLINGLPLSSPTTGPFRNAANLTTFDAGVVGNEQLAKRLPILQLLPPDFVNNLRSLQGEGTFNPVEFLAEVDDVMYSAARQFYGLGLIAGMPAGAVDVRPKRLPDGTAVIEYVGKDKKVIKTSEPMTFQEARLQAESIKKAAASTGGNVALKAIQGWTNFQRGIMSDMYLALSPRNWIRNAMGAITMAYSVDGYSMRGVQSILDDLARDTGGAAPTLRTFAVQAGYNRGQALGAGQISSGIIDPIAEFITRNPDNPVSRFMRGAYSIPYGSKEIPIGGGMTVGLGEEANYLKVFDAGYTRTKIAAWRMEAEQLAQALARGGVPEEWAQHFSWFLTEQGPRLPKNELSDKAYDLVMSEEGRIATLTALGIDPHIVPYDQWSQLDDLLSNISQYTDDEAMGIVRQVFDAARQYPARTLSQFTPQQGRYAWTDFDNAVEGGLIQQSLQDAAQRAGIDPTQAQQQIAAVVKQVQDGDAQWDVFRQDLTDLTQRAIASGGDATRGLLGVAMDFAAGAMDAKIAARTAVDEAARYAVALQTPEAWARKWQANVSEWGKYGQTLTQLTEQYRTVLGQVAAGQPHTPQFDIYKTILRWMEFDPEKLRQARTYTLGAPVAEDSWMWQELIEASRSSVDNSLLHLMEAFRRYPSAANFDLLTESMREMERMGAKAAGFIDAAKAEGTKGQALYNLRNNVWTSYFDEAVNYNKAMSKVMVALGMVDEAGASTKWVDDFAGGEFQLLYPNEDGTWSALRSDDNTFHIFAAPGVEGSRPNVPQEVMDAYNTALGRGDQVVNAVMDEVAQVADGAAPAVAPLDATIEQARWAENAQLDAEMLSYRNSPFTRGGPMPQRPIGAWQTVEEMPGQRRGATRDTISVRRPDGTWEEVDVDAAPYKRDIYAVDIDPRATKQQLLDTHRDSLNGAGYTDTQLSRMSKAEVTGAVEVAAADEFGPEVTFPRPAYPNAGITEEQLWRTSDPDPSKWTEPTTEPRLPGYGSAGARSAEPLAAGERTQRPLRGVGLDPWTDEPVTQPRGGRGGLGADIRDRGDLPATGATPVQPEPTPPTRPPTVAYGGAKPRGSIPTDAEIRRAANGAGIPTASKAGRPTDHHLVASINKRTGSSVDRLDQLTDSERVAAVEAMAQRAVEQTTPATEVASRMDMTPEESIAPTEPLLNVSPEDIPYQRAYDAHRGTSMVPDERARGVQQEYVRHMQAIEAELSRYATTPESRAALQQALGEYRQNYVNRQIGILDAKSRTMSSMVTGPSNFLTARNQKRLDIETRRINEFLEWQKRAEKRLNDQFNPQAPRAISSDREDAVDALLVKLAKAEELQRRMVAANKIIRGKGDDATKVQRLVDELGFTEDNARKALEPDFMGRVGFPEYATKNNNAEIRRLRQRMDEVQAQQARPSNRTDFQGGFVLDNQDNNRLQIFFDQKPDAEMIANLKRNGFKWAPSEKAWQRQRTEAARYSTERVLGVKLGEVVTAASKAEDTVATNLPAGYKLAKGERFAGAGKWAVFDGEGKPAAGFRNTPEEALQAYVELRKRSDEAATARQAYDDAIAQLKSGNITDDALKAISGGNDRITRQRAIDALRSMGLKETEAKQILKRAGLYGETSGGAMLYDPEEVIRFGLDKLNQVPTPTVGTGNAPTFGRGTRTSQTSTTSMFAESGEDLPLVSGAAPRAQTTGTFTPQDATRTESMFDLRPQMGSVEPSYKPKVDAPSVQGGQQLSEADRALLEQGGNAVSKQRLVDRFGDTLRAQGLTDAQISRMSKEEIRSRLLTGGASKAAKEPSVYTPGDAAKLEISAAKEARAAIRTAWSREVQGAWEGIGSIDAYAMKYSRDGLVNLNLNKSEIKTFEDIYGTIVAGRRIDSIDDVRNFFQEYVDLSETIKASEGTIAKAKQFAKKSAAEILKETRDEFIAAGYTDAELSELSKSRRALLDTLASIRGDAPEEFGMAAYDFRVPFFAETDEGKDLYRTLLDRTLNSRRNGGMKSPEVGEAADDVLGQLGRAEQRIIDTLPQLRQGLPNVLTPQQRLQVWDQVRRSINKQDSIQAQARYVGEKLGNWVMLNRATDTRYADATLGLLFPFHFFMSRMPSRLASMAVNKPGLINLYYEVEDELSKYHQREGTPVRLSDTIPLGGGYYMGNPLSWVLPFNAYITPNAYVRPEEGDGNVERTVDTVLQRIPGLFPATQYGIAAGLDYIEPKKDGTKRTDDFELGDFLPIYRWGGSAYQAMTGNIGPQGFMRYGDRWDSYRARRSAGVIAAEQDIDSTTAQYAQQIINNRYAGKPEGENVDPAYLKEATKLANQAIKEAGVERAMATGGSWATGVGFYRYPEGEREMRDASRQYGQLGYDPINNPYGSKEAQRQHLAANPALPGWWSKDDALPGTTAQLSQHYAEKAKLRDLKSQAEQQAVYGLNLQRASRREMIDARQAAGAPFQEQIDAIDEQIAELQNQQPGKVPDLQGASQQEIAAALAPGNARPFGGMNPREVSASFATSTLYEATRLPGKPKRPGEGASSVEWRTYIEELQAYFQRQEDYVVGALTNQTTTSDILRERRGPIKHTENQARELWWKFQHEDETPGERARYEQLDRMDAQQDAVSDAGRANVDARVRGGSKLLDTYLGTPKGDERTTLRAKDWRYSAALLAAYNPETYDTLITEFGKGAVQQYYTAQAKRPEYPAEAASDEEMQAYYDALDQFNTQYPLYNEVNLWLNGRSKWADFNSSSPITYNNGQEWQQAQAIFGPDIFDIEREATEASLNGTYLQWRNANPQDNMLLTGYREWQKALREAPGSVDELATVQWGINPAAMRASVLPPGMTPRPQPQIPPQAQQPGQPGSMADVVRQPYDVPGARRAPTGAAQQPQAGIVPSPTAGAAPPSQQGAARLAGIIPPRGAGQPLTAQEWANRNPKYVESARIGAEIQARRSSVGEIWGEEALAVWDGYFALPKDSEARAAYKQANPLVSAMLLTAYNSQQYQQALADGFTNEDILGWAARPPYEGDGGARQAYWDTNPRAWLFNQYLNGRPQAYDSTQEPSEDFTYNWGQDYAAAKEMFGPNIWDIVLMQRGLPDDRAMRAQFYQQFPQYSAWADWWYSNLPDNGYVGTASAYGGRAYYGGGGGGGSPWLGGSGGGGGGSYGPRVDPRYMDRSLWEGPGQQRQWIPYSNPNPDWLRSGQQLAPDPIQRWRRPTW